MIFHTFVSKIKAIVRSRIFQVSTSIVLLLIVFRSVHIVDVLIKLRAVPLTTNILYIVLLLFVIFLTSIRWQLLLTKSITRSHTVSFFAASMMGLFYNLFLPSINGGDVMKWTLLPLLPHSKKRIIFSIMYDRIVGLAGLIFVGLICGLAGSFFFKVQLSQEMMIGLSTLSLGSFVVVLLLINPHILSSNVYLRRFPKVEIIGNFLFERRRETLIGLLLTFISQFLFFTAMWIIAVPLGFSVPLWQMILFGSLAFVFASLPLSFSGFGTTELAFLYFFQPLGIQQEIILALTTMLVLYKFLFAGLGWIIGSCYQTFHIVTPER